MVKQKVPENTAGSNVSVCSGLFYASDADSEAQHRKALVKLKKKEVQKPASLEKENVFQQSVIHPVCLFYRGDFSATKGKFWKMGLTRSSPSPSQPLSKDQKMSSWAWKPLIMLRTSNQSIWMLGCDDRSPSLTESPKLSLMAHLQT